MCKEARKDTTDLKDVVKPFISEDITEEPHYIYIITSQSEWIEIEGDKFYIGNTALILKPNIRFCFNKCLSKGFLVSLLNNSKYPKGKLFAYQCDECNMITLARAH